MAPLQESIPIGEQASNKKWGTHLACRTPMLDARDGDVECVDVARGPDPACKFDCRVPRTTAETFALHTIGIASQQRYVSRFTLRAVEYVVADQSQADRQIIHITRLWELLDDPHLNKPWVNPRRRQSLHFLPFGVAHHRGGNARRWARHLRSFQAYCRGRAHSNPHRASRARSLDCVSVKPATARTVKTTASAVQAPFDTKSVAEQDESCTRAAACRGHRRRHGEHRWRRPLLSSSSRS
jgi:hypothetical protein